MSDRPVLAIRRVLVAVDHSPGARFALEAAADVAAAFHASLQALFIEEAELAGMADHPATSELYLGSGAVRSWTPPGLRLELRARQAQVQRDLRRAAEARDVTWSFSVTTGELGPEVRRAAAEADFTAVGCERWGRTLGAGRRGRAEMLRSTSGPTLLHNEGRLTQLPIVVLYDGSEGARRALEIAARLSAPAARAIQVLVVPAAPGPSQPPSSRDARAEEVRRLAAQLGARIQLRPVASDRGASVARILGLYRHHLLVVPAGSTAVRGPAARTVLKSASSILVVPGAPA